jgi:hypothetical protein
MTTPNPTTAGTTTIIDSLAPARDHIAAAQLARDDHPALSFSATRQRAIEQTLSFSAAAAGATPEMSSRYPRAA